MNFLTIAQLAQFSGIKAHTIRIWEQRYGALIPKRTAGNTRYYNSLDLRRLLNIVSLMEQYKVSDLCKMKDKNLNELVENIYLQNTSDKHDHFISQLISAGMEFNELHFQKILSHCFLRFGFTETYKTIVYPLLNRVGLLWAVDLLPPAHEHFISNIIRQKILTATDSLPLPKENAKKWALFLPEDEYHEIGLLMTQYMLKLSGEKVYYLGASMPLNTLYSAYKSIQPDALLFFFIHNNSPENISRYLSALSNNCKNSKVYITGNEKLISKLKLSGKVTWLKTMEDLEKSISTHDSKF